jgi:hypothetical protein
MTEIQKLQTTTRFIRILVVALVTILLALLFLAWFDPPAKAQNVGFGDSIMEGTGPAMGIPTYARKSMGSCWILGHMPTGQYEHAAISAGINDAPGICLAQIRARIKARYVTWILPANINSARAHVEAIARQFGDKTVSYSCKGGCNKRNFHPGSYGAVAKAVWDTWK